MFDLIKKIISRHNTKSAEGEKLFLQGIKSASANQHDKAIEFFTRSIAVLDIYPAPFINRGASYQYQERYLDAWDDYAHAFQMEMTNPSPSVKMHLHALNKNMNTIAPLMVINKEKGDEIRNALVTDGIEHFTKRWAEELTKKLQNDKKLIRHFFLEEMKELYDLDGDHRSFALSNGFENSEYLSIKDNFNTVDAFILMKSILCCFSREPKKMLHIRTGILSHLNNTITPSNLINNSKKQINDMLINLNVSVLLITQSGKVVMVSEDLQERQHDWLGGQIIEVMINNPEREPYFIYYENEDYYLKIVSSMMGHTNFDDYTNFANYRVTVAQQLCMYLVIFMLEKFRVDISHPQMHFSHNRIHTNVIAYVECLGNWFPIRHNSDEADSATERKVAAVNSGEADISEFISIHELSPG